MTPIETENRCGSRLIWP